MHYKVFFLLKLNYASVEEGGGWGGVMIVENGVKTEFVPNSELLKQSCLDLYSCKTIIIYAMTYILYAKSVNAAVMKEKK